MPWSIGLVVEEEREDWGALQYVLRSAGFDCRIYAIDSATPASLRSGIPEDVNIAVIIRAGVVPRTRGIEYAIAMLVSGASDLFIGVYDQIIDDDGHIMSSPLPRWRRWLLRLVTDGSLSRVPCGVIAGEVDSLRVLISELRATGPAWPLELGWLARRYGIRGDELPLAVRAYDDQPWRPTARSLLRLFYRMRRAVGRSEYRPPRRCPICFSMDVRTRDQIDGNVIRECRRCKCRYLSHIPSPEEIERTRLLRLDGARLRELDGRAADEAKVKTLQRRAKRLARLLPPGSKLLEVGARSGELGELLSSRFEYTGIEVDDSSARAARERGLEVYRASLTDYVSLSGAYDGVVMYDVIEHLPNPHDAVSRIRELVRPGGYLVLTTPDTESLTALACGRRWSAHKVPEHIVLYSRSALVEMLENAGFEIVSASGDYRYFDHERLRVALRRWPSWVARFGASVLAALPDPFPVSSGCIRVIAQKRSGPPYAVRPVPSVEMSRAR